MKHPETENEVQALLDELGEDLEVDASSADLYMPEIYALDVWASRRVAAVRDANRVRLQAQANKGLNPRVAEEAQRQFDALCREIAIIDRRYPAAKRLSHEIMEQEATSRHG